MLWMLLNIYTENGCCYWAHNSVAGWSTLNSIRTIFPLPLSYFITFVCNHYLLSSFNMYVFLKLLWQQFQATFQITCVKIFDDEYCWMLCYTSNNKLVLPILVYSQSRNDWYRLGSACSSHQPQWWTGGSDMQHKSALTEEPNHTSLICHQ